MKFSGAMKIALALSVSFADASNAQQATSPESPDIKLVVRTSGGERDTLPVFDGRHSIASSSLYYRDGHLGIGRFPTTALDVEGESRFAGVAYFLPIRGATASEGSASHSVRLGASVYNSTLKAAVQPFLQFTAEPVGNNTATPSAALHLLYNGGSGAPIESGLYFNADGTIHFASAQTFPIAAGPQGPAGPAGPVGPSGPAGTLTLPFFGAASTSSDNSPVFEIGNSGSGTGMIVFGGESSYGLQSYGGGTGDDQNDGGTGILARGGEGGYSMNGPYGGVGIRAIGGYGHDGGGNAIEAYGGDSNFEPVGLAIYAVAGKAAAADQDDSPVAGYFVGDVNIQGNLSKSGGSFKIDDPMDPANKYLYHSFVESPDMKNIYDGNVTTDGRGEAVVTMPEYFEALNRDFRYQLTVIGQFAQAIIATKISNGAFVIKTDKPNVEVSWMVTGIRQDAWANAHRIPIEQDKAGRDKGHYLHPELFGQQKEARILPAGVGLQKAKSARR